MIVYYIGINDGFIKDKSMSFHMANSFIKLVLMFLSYPYLLLHEKIYAKYILDYFINVYEYLAAYVSVYHMSIWCQQRIREGVGSPWAGVTEGCELLYRYWKLNPFCWRATSAINH